MNATPLIWTALPRHPAKVIERALGCTTRQAWRIVSTGRVPGRFRAALIEVLDRAIEHSRAKLGEAERELKYIRETAMVERAQARLLESDLAGAAVAQRQAGPSRAGDARTVGGKRGQGN